MYKYLYIYTYDIPIIFPWYQSRVGPLATGVNQPTLKEFLNSESPKSRIVPGQSLHLVC